ncbi:flavin-containing monooxygenase [Paraphaeosphaeria sporulosa]|uniref:Flavin-containing monooxygenase n=1 Tax=Paraphaeosphaeria sporulosa TaxID=1460663 RepID=A0A177C4W4_9PLEO|nr:flavin-containing monooxygenase [Paraphaeosphaeria sporulosa]OAG01922.1 flavin-containing monooxygenase [Paraphaeosphaeria sporulosa]
MAKFPSRPVSLTLHPAKLPQPNIPDDLDHVRITSEGLQRLDCLSVSDLTEDAIWRDTCALTGTLRTFYSAKLLLKVWQQLYSKHSPTDFSINPKTSRVIRLGPHGAWVESMFTFKTHGPYPATCSGIIGLVPANDEQTRWKIWLLSTILERIHGQPDVEYLQPLKPEHSQTEPRIGECECRQRSCTNGHTATPSQYECIVVGGSITGLCMAARLQAMGISYLLVEKHDNVGDNWTQDRYHSLKLHTSKCFNQMPYEPRTFREEHPYHLGTSDLADGFQRFVDTFGINCMLGTELRAGTHDPATDRWTLKLKQGEETVTISANHCVLAVGNMGIKPQMPTYPGRELFQGEVMHGIQWRNADRWRGQKKRGVCIGSANTAHGVIADMANAGFASVTMIQRSRTFLLPSSTFGALVDPVYNYETPLPLSDRMLLGYPLPVKRLMAKAGIKMCADANPKYFDEMEARGWEIERDGDLWGMMYDREGGHFFDTSSGKHIANGSVKVICNALPVAYTPTGLEMSDGTHLDADVIIFATGYTGTLRDTATKIFGDEIGNKLEEFWQCDEEGESRGAWKFTGHPKLWYTGHGFAHARYYSRFVAIHIKAELEGRPLETYTDTPSV